MVNGLISFKKKVEQTTKIMPIAPCQTGTNGMRRVTRLRELTATKQRRFHQ